MTDSSRAAFGLVALMGGMGAAHLLVPRPFDTLVPSRLPGRPRFWTLASGASELVCAAAVAHPRTRRAGALATAWLLVAVFPANLKMARDWRTRSSLLRAAAYGRLPLQVPLIAWALRVAREAE
ncbi:DoxX family protein [Actinomadura terrae]|uniref:DoxX family protein n=1 Tax=Actinomadura terrae TaxID=604353 RepID=UPI001FA78637|nr:hypothetical protein [Actinomadura terrae]